MAANDYCTLDDVKNRLPDVTWAEKYDLVLARIIIEASRKIDLYLGRRPGAFAVSVDESRYFDGSGALELWIGELAAVPTKVEVAEAGEVDDLTGTGGTYTTWGSSDYMVWPRNAILDRQPIRRLDIDILNGTKTIWYSYPRAVKITGKFGYTTTTPEEVQEASIITAVRAFGRAQQAFRDVGATLSLEQLRYIQALDPEVQMMVYHLREPEI